MKIPRLKVRPTSQQSVAQFRGIWHNPTAPIGYWYDARNLSSDLSPNAIGRRARRTMLNVDGNNPDAPIVAMAGGDHLVLLDRDGKLWCNGASLQLPFQTQTTYCWAFSVPQTGSRKFVKPASGSADSLDALGRFGRGANILTEDERNRTLVWEAGNEAWRLNGINELDTWVEERYLDGQRYNVYTFTDNQIEIWCESMPADGYTIGLRTWSETAIVETDRQLVRMGANVIIWPDKIFVNVVKLATGVEMEPGTDYGGLEGGINGFVQTLTLCNQDGDPYNGVTVSTTAPTGGYWLDVSGDKPELREWNVATSMWVQISSTFVRVSSLDYADPNMASIKAFDTVRIIAEGEAGVDEEARKLLQGAHYLYNVIDNGDDSCDIVISGILSSDSITCTATQISLTKRIPEMDYVVEAGNRLWGCRYSEADQINEIYASKLGDPTNWEVFQGLSTDSWTASRGTPAPYTGAAVLDGHPLFFREASLDKVYPSAAGAHQIQIFDLDGVEQGAANSLCVIKNRLYYKSPNGIMVYTGTMPACISSGFEDMRFRGGSAARHRNKYCISTTLESTGETVVLIYDLDSGDWQIEDEAWTGRAVTWQDDLYYIEDGSIKSMAESSGYGIVSWWAETAPQAIHYNSAAQSLTEHKWISYLRIRFRMLDNGSLHRANLLRIYISYEDGPWELKKQFSADSTALRTWELNFLPKRRDNFRLRLEGAGPVQIYDIAWRMERSQGGH